MKEYIQLIKQLDTTNKTNQKKKLIQDYLVRENGSQDAVWAVYFLLGEKLKGIPFRRKDLKDIFCKVHGLSDEFYTENRSFVGDSSETMALLAHKNTKLIRQSIPNFIKKRLLLLDKNNVEKSETILKELWESYDFYTLFVIHKMLSGGLRIGVSKNLVIKAMAELYEIDEDILQQRFIQAFDPWQTNFDELIAKASDTEKLSQPYPFYLASPLSSPEATLENLEDWRAEWKWDGIRVQLIKRENEIYLWSRGGEIINESFPDIIAAAETLEQSFVLDGELLIIKDHDIQDFNSLQKRLRRKTVSKKMLLDLPANILVYDLLEIEGKDLRSTPLKHRLDQLEKFSRHFSFQISKPLPFSNLHDLKHLREQAREFNTEGLMLKRLDSVYRSGRKTGDWWKWKADPFSLDLVLTYAQAGSGRRSGLHTDYTFAIWDKDKSQLITLTKAYSGLTDQELNKFDQWIKSNTLERFGPVRRVKPNHVFEIHFEGIAPSSRHNSGLALRFPRIHRYRDDKTIEEANTLDDAEKLLEL
tara:strand:- start:3126 stop:4715 length:1590 start_codon:yes stop_codon:yes gene_type:complete